MVISGEEDKEISNCAQINHSTRKQNSLCQTGLTYLRKMDPGILSDELTKTLLIRKIALLIVVTTPVVNIFD